MCASAPIDLLGGCWEGDLKVTREKWPDALMKREKRLVKWEAVQGDADQGRWAKNKRGGLIVKGNARDLVSLACKVAAGENKSNLWNVHQCSIA